MLAAFGLANLLGSPFLGWLADRSSSRKTFLLLGLLLLGTATVMLTFATNVQVLVASRLFQGLSAAIIYTGGLALLMDTVGLEEIGKWMGFVLSFGNAGLLTSPTLGGLLYGKLGANAVFLAMGIIVALDIILRLGMVEKAGPRSNYLPEDEDSQPVSAVDHIESYPLIPSPAASQPDATKQNHVSVTRSRMPTLLILLGKPRILATMYGVMLTQTFITSFDGVLPVFLRHIFGWDSTRAGFMFLTVSVPTLAAPLTGMLSDRYGPRWVAAAGFMLVSAMLASLPLVHYDSVSQRVLLCVLLTVLGKHVRRHDSCSVNELTLGFAFSLTIPPLAADLASAVEHITKENPGIAGKAGAYGQAFSLLNCGISAGVLAGPSLAGFLHETFGWSIMARSLAVLSASAILPI
ncbi:MAG: hypothetical protein Q9163_004792, partial [Psora crenata]